MTLSASSTRAWSAGVLAEGQLAVGVVLQDHEVMLGSKRDQPAALLFGGATGRVVEVGDDVGDLIGPSSRMACSSAIDVDPVFLECTADDPDLLEQEQVRS